MNKTDKEVLEFIINSLEGGLVLKKNKKEVAFTYAGIYRKANPDWEGWKDIDEGKEPSIDLVLDFYKKKFLSKVKHLDLYPKIKYFMLDFIIHSGESRIKTLQKIIGTKVDGDFGPKSMSALRQYILINGEDYLFNELVIERIKYLNELVNSNRVRYGLYLNGWINRVFKFRKFLNAKF